MSDRGRIRCEVRDKVAYVTIDNPSRLNALDSSMMVDLVTVFEHVYSDDGIWIASITGAGHKSFCVGGDLKEAHSKDAATKPYRPMHGVARNPFEAIMECGKPVVAVLNGYTLGGGLEIALAADIRIASRNSTLGMPEVTVGLGGNFGAHLISRALPLGIAMEMLFTGASMSAEDALKWGIVNHVVASEELAAFSEQYVRRLLDNAPLSQRRIKASVYHGLSLPLAAAVRLNVGPDVYASEDREEGRNAFNEKRKPNWKAK